MKCVLYILVCCCLLQISQAQPNLSFTRISIDGSLGLYSNTVTALYQDKKGYIWVGNGNGLQRFDGNKFVDISAGKPGNDVMPHSLLSQIVPLPNGKLLLGFDLYGEVGLFDPSDFSYHKSAVQLDSTIWPRGQFVMIAGSGYQVFLNVIQDGILHYNATTNTFVNDRFFKISKAELPRSKLGIFYDAIKKQFLITTCTHLYIYDEQSKQLWSKDFNPQRLPLLNNPETMDCPRQAYIDSKRRIWIGTWGKNGQQLHCFDSTGSFSLKGDTTGLWEGPMSYAEWTQFLETRSGEFWVYGTNVLYNYDRTAGRFHYNINNPNNPTRGITCGQVYQMMEDRDGNVWAGTDNGLFYSNRNSSKAAIVNYTLDETKGQLFITSLLEMPGKSLWLSMWGQSIIVLDSNFTESRLSLSHTRTPLPATWSSGQKWAIDYAWSLCRRKTSGKILIGCQDGVLVQYNPLTGTAEYMNPPECGGATINQVVEDQHGVVWLSTYAGKLLRWEDGVFTEVYQMKSGAPRLLIDRQGWLWAVTSNTGVFTFDVATGKLLQHYTNNHTANSLYLNGGWDIAQLNDSIMVVASGALEFINRRTGQIRLLRYEDGLPANNARRVQVDKNGFLWIITQNGLCRYNPANDHIITYSRKDGIAVANTSIDAGLLLLNGNVAFAGNASLLLFQPATFTTSQVPSNVTITDFKLFNTYLPVDSLMQAPEIRLAQNQNSFSIFFSSLSYSQKDRLTYHYKMEGIDKEWSVADNTFSRNYSLLPPGHYTFKIYGENIDGQRSPNITEMHFYIRPPFWATGWFICACVIAVALIVYTIHNARISKLLAMEKLRNRVARDLHDDMGSTLSTINILSAMAKTKMSVDTVKTSEYLTKISDNSQRMMEAMDDIVWSIKPSNDSLQKITARMREFATNVLEAKDIALQFEVADDVCDIKLNMAARRDFFLVFKEAVNNAAKYSKADKVIISVSCKNRRLMMKVKDNGIGFVTKRADGNGLSNMAKRAEAMNGSVNIKSVPGEGTEVVMSIPVN